MGNKQSSGKTTVSIPNSRALGNEVHYKSSAPTHPTTNMNQGYPQTQMGYVPQQPYAQVYNPQFYNSQPPQIYNTAPLQPFQSPPQYPYQTQQQTDYNPQNPYASTQQMYDNIPPQQSTRVYDNMTQHYQQPPVTEGIVPSAPYFSSWGLQEDDEKEPMLLLDTTGSMNFGTSQDDPTPRKETLREAISLIVQVLETHDSQAVHEEEGGGLRTVTFSGGKAEDIEDINSRNLRQKWSEIKWRGGYLNNIVLTLTLMIVHLLCQDGKNLWKSSWKSLVI